MRADDDIGHQDHGLSVTLLQPAVKGPAVAGIHKDIHSVIHSVIHWMLGGAKHRPQGFEDPISRCQKCSSSLIGIVLPQNGTVQDEQYMSLANLL